VPVSLRLHHEPRTRKARNEDRGFIIIIIIFFHVQHSKSCSHRREGPSPISVATRKPWRRVHKVYLEEEMITGRWQPCLAYSLESLKYSSHFAHRGIYFRKKFFQCFIWPSKVLFRFQSFVLVMPLISVASMEWNNGCTWKSIQLPR
jgi:hypothetical protein